MESLGEATVFSTLTSNYRYWQFETDERDRNKTVFTLHHGPLRLTRMPFGLITAPATIQSAMDVILVSVRWEFVAFTWTKFSSLPGRRRTKLTTISSYCGYCTIQKSSSSWRSVSSVLRQLTAWTRLSGPSALNCRNAGPRLW